MALDMLQIYDIAKLNQEGYLTTQIAEMFSTSPVSVLKALAFVANTSEDTITQVHDLFGQGCSLERISVDTGVDLEALKSILPDGDLSDSVKLTLLSEAIAGRQTIRTIARTLSISSTQALIYLQSCSADLDRDTLARILFAIDTRNLLLGHSPDALLHYLSRCEVLAKGIGVETSNLNLIVSDYNRGLPLSEISREWKCELDKLKLIFPNVGLTQEVKQEILRLNEAGLSVKGISSEVGLGLSTIIEYLDCEGVKCQKADGRNSTNGKKGGESIRYFYGINDSEVYFRADISSGQMFTHQLEDFEYKVGSSWADTPSGQLFTGGSYDPKEAVMVHSRADFAWSYRSEMMLSRQFHNSIYYKGHVYVVGGYHKGTLRECERYNTKYDYWENLAPLVIGVRFTSAIALNEAIYVLGGTLKVDVGTTKHAKSALIQEYSVLNDSWKVLDINLPFRSSNLPCFKVKDNSELIYFIIENRLYTFKPRASRIQHILTLPQRTNLIRSPCTYRDGHIYCISDMNMSSLAEEGFTNLQLRLGVSLVQ